MVITILDDSLNLETHNKFDHDKSRTKSKGALDDIQLSSWK